MEAPPPCQPAKWQDRRSWPQPQKSTEKPAFPPKITQTGVSRGMTNRVRLLVLLAGLGLAACASTAPKPVPASPPPPVTAPPPTAPLPPSSGDAKFAAFLAEARTEALAQGITAETF